MILLASAFVVLPFLPASNLLVTVGFVIAERILVLPSFGFCLLVVFGLKKLMRRVKCYKRVSNKKRSKAFENKSCSKKGISSFLGVIHLFLCVMRDICTAHNPKKPRLANGRKTVQLGAKRMSFECQSPLQHCQSSCGQAR